MKSFTVGVVVGAVIGAVYVVVWSIVAVASDIETGVM